MLSGVVGTSGGSEAKQGFGIANVSGAHNKHVNVVNSRVKGMVQGLPGLRKSMQPIADNTLQRHTAVQKSGNMSVAAKLLDPVIMSGVIQSVQLQQEREQQQQQEQEQQQQEEREQQQQEEGGQQQQKEGRGPWMPQKAKDRAAAYPGDILKGMMGHLSAKALEILQDLAAMEAAKLGGVIVHQLLWLTLINGLMRDHADSQVK
ncbi:hypothetical protein DUNSADRAFT_15691 [Dunaliella salina]|uniref:Encoded protein n=1 Tax=Dunaliella salina TaxID=3046 RepID=A0ABQ7G4W7_DUNSA|nr:hypothetical protein DUNSADRAFT_15691 [Dunaliella salina]|eukprot:KAF5829650.1 hypothetical protein DUNSADRAFT_15691 [Dunaliella salina]